jgi:hemerythrin superfamily protein
MPRKSSSTKSGGGSPRKKRSAHKEPDALELLKADHENVLALLSRHASASPQEQMPLARQIFNALDIHAVVEEEIFYPALREQGDVKELGALEDDDSEAIDGKDLSEGTDENGMDKDEDHEATVLEQEEQDNEEEGEDLITLAYEDHRAVKELIRQLKGLEPSSDQYRARFEELKEAVIDHVGEEEEVMFPEAKLKLDTKQLGAEIAKRRSELAASMAA